MRTGKSSAVADIAAQLGNEGRSEPHTPDAAAGDLLAFGQELDIFAADAIAPPKRGPGRPIGSKSRTTLQLSRFLQAKGYRDPAEFLAAIVSMDLPALATELNLAEGGRFEALKLQIAAAKELMPYFHQRMPLAVERIGDNHRPLFIINDGPAGLGARLADAVERMSAHEIVDFQEVSEVPPASSHDGRQSDEG